MSYETPALRKYEDHLAADEGELRDHLLDRIAVALSADAEKMEIPSRVEAVDAVLGFSAGGKQATPEAEIALEEAMVNEDDIRTSIIFAREFLRDVRIAPTQIQYLCEEAIRAGCQGHRAEIFASEVAGGCSASATVIASLERVETVSISNLHLL